MMDLSVIYQILWVQQDQRVLQDLWNPFRGFFGTSWAHVSVPADFTSRWFSIPPNIRGKRGLPVLGVHVHPVHPPSSEPALWELYYKSKATKQDGIERFTVKNFVRNFWVI